MEEFNSLKRVKYALKHKEADRIPFDLGGALVAGINIKSLSNFYSYIGMDTSLEIWDEITQIGKISNDFIDRLKIDIKNVSPSPPLNKGLDRKSVV